MAGVRVGLGSETLLEECSNLPGVVQHASVYVWFGATSAENYMSHKIIVPGGLFSSASDTACGRTVVYEIDGDFSQQSEIVPSMLFSDSGSIFLKCDIQHPMETVFN